MRNFWSISKPLVLATLLIALLLGLLALLRPEESLPPAPPIVITNIKTQLQPDGKTYRISLTGQGFTPDTRITLTPELPRDENVLDQALAGLMHGNKIISEGKYLYVLSHDVGLQILDCSDPANLQLITTLPIEGRALDMVLKDGQACIITVEGMLLLVDLHTPIAPRILSETYISAGLQSIALHEHTAWILNLASTIFQVDLSAPEAPVHLGGILQDDGFPINKLFAQGDILLATTRSNTLLFLNPKPSSTKRWVSKIPIFTPIKDLLIADDKTLYILTTKALHAYEVTQIREPKYLFEIPLPSPAITHMAIAETSLALISEDGHILTCDLKDPLSPRIQLVARTNNPSPLRGFAVSGKHAFVATMDDGILSISLESHKINTSSFGNIVPFSAFEVSESTALASKDKPPYALQALDLKQLPTLKQQAWLPLNYRPSKIAATKLLAADLRINQSAIGLYSIDPPEQLRELGSLVLPDGEIPLSLDLKEDLLVVGTGNNQLHLYDLSHPEAPKRLSSLSLEAQPKAISIKNTTAFVALNAQGLSILDISNPQNPRLLATVSRPWPDRALTNILDVAVAGDAAYLANASDGVMVVDIKSLESPKLSTLVPTMEGVASNVAIWGEYLYMTTDNDIWVFDIRTPLKPALLCRIPIPGIQGRVRFSGKYLLAGIKLQNLYGGILPMPLPRRIDCFSLEEDGRINLTILAPEAEGTYGLTLANHNGITEKRGVIRVPAP